MVAVVLSVWAAGPALMVVSGGVVSMVQVTLAGVTSVLPSASVARTEKGCSPSARPVSSTGEGHAAYPAPSSEHSKVAPASAEKLMIAEVLFVAPDGPASIVVTGAAVSTVHVRLAGVPSMLPASSMACTQKVCEPTERSGYVTGDVQEAKV